VLPTMLLIGFIGGLLLPSRGWWVVAVSAIGWTFLLVGDGVITSVQEVLTGGLVAGLNAGLGVVVGAVIRHRIEWCRYRMTLPNARGATGRAQ
jgi:hypothetical protein